MPFPHAFSLCSATALQRNERSRQSAAPDPALRCGECGLEAKPADEEKKETDLEPHFDDDVPLGTLGYGIAGNGAERPAEASAVDGNLLEGEFVEPGIPDPELF